MPHGGKLPAKYDKFLGIFSDNLRDNGKYSVVFGKNILNMRFLYDNAFNGRHERGQCAIKSAKMGSIYGPENMVGDASERREN
jgi:hypothetical protein